MVGWASKKSSMNKPIRASHLEILLCSFLLTCGNIGISCTIKIFFKPFKKKKKNFLSSTGCVNVSYLPSELGIEFQLTLNGKPIIDEKISGEREREQKNKNLLIVLSRLRFCNSKANFWVFAHFNQPFSSINSLNVFWD